MQSIPGDADAAAADGAAANSPHVLVVPFPAQGHTNPCLSIAHYLAASGISVTLVQARADDQLLRQCSPISINGNHIPASDHPSLIRNKTIPSGFDHSQPFSVEIFFAAIDIMRQALTELLQKIMLEDNPPVCLLIDNLFGCGDAIAAKFGLSRVDIWTTSASLFSMGMHVPDLVARSFIPATDEGAKNKIVDFIPGLSPLRMADFPKNLLAENFVQSDMFAFLRSKFENAKSADRVLVNSMYELETSVIEALHSKDHVHVHPIGPLHMMNKATDLSGSLIQEDNDCLSWLDQQQQSSVLYIAFGSIVSVEENAITELACGLEASGESFLWVIRRDTYKNKASVKEVLPEGFMERTSDRGLVISWAPQLAVLGHSSVRAFLTHCGWNSVLESLSNGVPMLGFPQMGDQNTNLKFIVHDWKVGLSLSKEQVNTQTVERAGVRSAITAIMRGEEGLQARMHAGEWKKIVENATQGSSKHNLQKLVEDLKHGRLKHPKH